MKNKKLWLIFLITLGATYLLTWIIPATTYNDAGALTLGAISPVGIWDAFYYLVMQLAWFYPVIIFVIFMGAFYGVINKTGALRTLVEKIASKFKKKEKRFLLVVSSAFILVAGLTGISFPLFFFVPLCVAIILNLGFNKITALLATVGAMLVGFIGCIYSTSLYSVITTYVKAGLGYAPYKFLLLALGIALVGGYLYLTAKIGKGKEKEEIDDSMLFIEKIEGKRKIKVWPIITAYSVILGLFILGLTPWASMFNTTIFTDFNTALLGVKIGSFTIFQSLFGSTLTAFGSWTLVQASALLAIVTLALVIVYKVKWVEVYEGVISGIKKFLPTIIMLLTVNLAFIFVSQSGIITTIVNFLISLTNGINLFTYSAASLIGGSLVNESYITSYITGTMNTTLGTTANLPLLVFIQQAMYGIAMLLVPTSIYLLAGLSYFEVEYTKWIKAIWKLVVVLFIVALIVLSIAMML